MAKLLVPKPISGGLLLSYKCNSECKHCMYACSPKCRANWISLDDAGRVLTQLHAAFEHSYPARTSRLGLNFGLHFTGGEPFLNFRLLLSLVKIAHKIGFPSTFVETNCFWCSDDKETEEKLVQLKNAGLHGVLVSVNPFIFEYVPFEKTLRAINIGRKVFGENVMVYQDFFYQQFRSLKIKGTLSFQDYVHKAGVRSLRFVELIPMGRACYELGHLFVKRPAEAFVSESCLDELTRPWHVHVDNYCNYMTGYCGGISLGDARNLDQICQGIKLDDYPIIAMLTSDNGIGKLLQFSVDEYNYKELKDGYVSKCHLCLDMRKHIVEQTSEFRELKSEEFYRNI
ncbi:4Fe-4S cluster-binding domain-containing protein [Candidatus Bathyarchaeota archaeon]|nr:4Fe-4S cluster-binding domain-containing protein [Candidatus Bathyarchaeota archaeon]